MANPDIVKYITEARKAGDSDELIRSTLNSAGWDPKDVDEGFSAAAAPAEAPKPKSVEAPPKPEEPGKKPEGAAPAKPSKAKGQIVAVIVVLLVLGGSAFLALRSGVIQMPFSAQLESTQAAQGSEIEPSEAPESMQVKTLPERCLFGPGFMCKEYDVQTSSISVTLENGFGRDIEIMSIRADTCEKEFNTPLADGTSSSFMIDGCSNGEDGTFYMGELVVMYKAVGVGLPHEALGNIDKMIGEGSASTAPKSVVQERPEAEDCPQIQGPPVEEWNPIPMIHTFQNTEQVLDNLMIDVLINETGFMEPSKRFEEYAESLDYGDYELAYTDYYGEMVPDVVPLCIVGMPENGQDPDNNYCAMIINKKGTEDQYILWLEFEVSEPFPMAVIPYGAIEPVEMAFVNATYLGSSCEFYN